MAITPFTSTSSTKIPVEPHCFSCNKQVETVLKCSKCKYAIYCNRECQTDDWQKHKKNCTELAFRQCGITKEKAKQNCDSLLKIDEKATNALSKTNASLARITSLYAKIKECRENTPTEPLTVVALKIQVLEEELKIESSKYLRLKKVLSKHMDRLKKADHKSKKIALQASGLLKHLRGIDSTAYNSTSLT